ncbi:hypothetical protein, partial [Brucella pseudogrignonensis]|uniref:hypothetical protein n=1 Tax=Brucella pseudogrignonensis TaxID=419475 RepID=UPI0035BC6609
PSAAGLLPRLIKLRDTKKAADENLRPFSLVATANMTNSAMLYLFVLARILLRNLCDFHSYHAPKLILHRP